MDARRRRARSKDGGRGEGEVAEPIPLVDLSIQQGEVADEVAAGWARVVDDNAFILGEDVAEFEREYAAAIGVAHCVGVGNGTDGLELSLRALGIGPGDEVIVPVNSFVASALAVRRAGAVPVFVDADPEYLLIDPDEVKRKLGPGVRAVMPVDLFGQVAPMAELGSLASGAGLDVVEDAAQSHLAAQNKRRAGSFGAVAATSFYPGKNLGAYGDGGAVLTDDDALAVRVRVLRNYGSDDQYDHPETGFNSRLDTVHAVVLRAKLRRLERWNEQRRIAARRYEALLADLEEVRLPTTRPGNLHVWHLYVVRVPRRDAALRALREQGIHAGIHYPVPIHLHGAFADLGYGRGDFPVAEAAAMEILSLPIYPGIESAQQERIAEALGQALARR
ncbi:MAG: DegT/DnrJ/EryC1/StrS family aminotransferase [Acidimicrobiia bacterium]